MSEITPEPTEGLARHFLTSGRATTGSRQTPTETGLIPQVRKDFTCGKSVINSCGLPMCMQETVQEMQPDEDFNDCGGDLEPEGQPKGAPDMQFLPKGSVMPAGALGRNANMSGQQKAVPSSHHVQLSRFSTAGAGRGMAVQQAVGNSSESNQQTLRQQSQNVQPAGARSAEHVGLREQIRLRAAADFAREKQEAKDRQAAARQAKGEELARGSKSAKRNGKENVSGKHNVSGGSAAAGKRSKRGVKGKHKVMAARNALSEGEDDLAARNRKPRNVVTKGGVAAAKNRKQFDDDDEEEEFDYGQGETGEDEDDVDSDNDGEEDSDNEPLGKKGKRG